MGDSKTRMVRLSQDAHAYLRESARLVGVLDPDPADRSLLTIQGCAGFAALLLFRNLVRQADDAGYLGIVNQELLSLARYKPIAESQTPES